MNGLTEIRNSNGGAYEQRNGSAVVFGSQIERVLALGCPQSVLTRALERHNKRFSRDLPISKPRTAPQPKPRVKTDAERKALAARQGVFIEADALRAKNLQVTTQATQQQKDNELAEKMRVAAGRSK